MAAPNHHSKLVLKVSHVEANDMPETESWGQGKQDPYCLIKFSGQEKRTKTKDEAGVSCKWEGEEFQLEADVPTFQKADSQVIFEVWNANVLKDNIIGKTTCPISSLLSSVGVATSFSLKLQQDKGAQKGQLKCTLTCLDPHGLLQPKPSAVEPPTPTTASISPPSTTPVVPPTTLAPTTNHAAAGPTSSSTKADAAPPPATTTTTEPTPASKTTPSPPPTTTSTDTPASAAKPPGGGDVLLSNEDQVVVKVWGMRAWGMPETEHLLLQKMGDRQDPYVKLILGSQQARSKTMNNAGVACEWQGEVLELPTVTVGHVTGKSLQVEVWNENPRNDTLIGTSQVGGFEAGGVLAKLATTGGEEQVTLALSKGGHIALKIGVTRKNANATVPLPIVAAKESQAAGTPNKEPPSSNPSPSPTEPPDRVRPQNLVVGESSSTSSSPAQSTLPLTDQVVVHLRTIRAEDMPETENALLAKLGNKQDPYVLAKMGAYQTRTPTVENGGTACVWEQGVEFPPITVADLLRTEIKMEVWNENMKLLKNDTLIATTSLQVDQAILSRCLVGGLPYEAKKDMRPKGRLRLAVSVTPYKSPPQSQQLQGSSSKTAVNQPPATAEAKQSPGEAKETKLLADKAPVTVSGAGDLHEGNKQTSPSTGGDASTATATNRPSDNKAALAPLGPQEAVLVQLSGFKAWDMPETETAVARMMGNKQDPYLKILAGGQERRSKVVNNGGTKCEWGNEVLQLPILPVSELAKTVVEIWNENPLGDTVIGSAVLGLNADMIARCLQNGYGEEVRLDLSRGAKVKGHVQLVVAAKRAPNLSAAPPAEEKTAKEATQADQKEVSTPLVPVLPPEEVVVVWAQSFKAMDLKETENVLAVKLLGNKQDPFIRLTLPGQARPLETKVVDNGGRACSWDGEVLQWPDMTVQELTHPKGPTSHYKVEVLNHNPGGQHNLIGSASFTLDPHLLAKSLESPDSPSSPYRLQLDLKDSKGKAHTGKVEFILTCKKRAGMVVRPIEPEETKMSKEAGEMVEMKGEEPIAHIPAVVVLRVANLEVKDLPDVEWAAVRLLGGKQDPYLVLRLGSQEFTSRTIENGGKACNWGKDMFDFQVIPSMLRSGQLEIQVFDKGTTSDTLIGIASYKVEHLFKSLGVEEKAILRLRQDKGQKGEIHLSLMCQDKDKWSMAAANIPDESKGPSVTSMDRIHLKVSSLGASGLPDTEGALMAMMKNLQDPYLILRVGNIEHRTSTVDNGGKACNWPANESVDFDITGDALLKGALEMECWNDNVIQDTLIGKGRILLNSLGEKLDQEQPLEVSLEPRKGLIKFKAVASKVLDDTDRAKGDKTSTTVEGPGVLLVHVVDLVPSHEGSATLHHPRVVLGLSPIDQTAQTRQLLEENVEAKVHQGGSGGFVWDQDVELACYCPPRSGPSNKPLVLEAKVVDQGGLIPGEHVLGRATLDVTEVVRSRKKERLCFNLQGKGGMLNVEVQFLGVGERKGEGGGGSEPQQPAVVPLKQPGIIRLFVLEAVGLRTVEDKQDPYVMVHKVPLDPDKPKAHGSDQLYKTKVIQDSGSSAAWVQCLELPFTAAEARHLANNPGWAPQLDLSVVDEGSSLLLRRDHPIASCTIPIAPQVLSTSSKPFRWWDVSFNGTNAGRLKLALQYLPHDKEGLGDRQGSSLPPVLTKKGSLYLAFLTGTKQILGAKADPKASIKCQVDIKPQPSTNKKKSASTAYAQVSATVGSVAWHEVVSLDYHPPHEDQDEGVPMVQVLVKAKGMLMDSDLGRVDLPLSTLVMIKVKGSKEEVDVTSIKPSRKTLPLSDGDLACGSIEVEYVFVPDSVREDPTIGKMLEDMQQQVKHPSPQGNDESSSKAEAVPGLVQVKLIRAKDLPQVESKQDPYVELRLMASPGSRPAKSSIAQNAGGDPEWSQSFTMLADDLSLETLCLTIKDGDNYLIDAFIGEVRVPLGPILASGQALKQPTTAWYKVVDKSQRETSGQVLLEIQITPEAPTNRATIQRVLAYGTASTITTQPASSLWVTVGSCLLDDDKSHSVPKTMISLAPDVAPDTSTRGAIDKEAKEVTPGGKTPFKFSAKEVADACKIAESKGSSPCLWFTVTGAKSSLYHSRIPLIGLLDKPDQALRRRLPLYRLGLGPKEDLPPPVGSIEVELAYRTQEPSEGPGKEMETQSGQLSVMCLNARNLPKAEGWGGKNDVFVVLTLIPGGNRAQTECHKDAGSNPVWDQERVLQVEDLWTSRLHVAVWEQDQGLLSSNTLIGEAYIAPAAIEAVQRGLAATNSTGPITHWFALTSPNKPNVSAGEIRLALNMSTQKQGPHVQDDEDAMDYRLETKPGQLFLSVVEARGTAVEHPKKKIGVEVHLKPGNFTAQTRPIQGGSQCRWEEQIVMPLLWTPQLSTVPHLLVKVEEKGMILDSTVGQVSIPLPPFVLYPGQPLDHWYSMGPNLQIRLRMYYMPTNVDNKATTAAGRRLALLGNRPAFKGILRVQAVSGQQLPPNLTDPRLRLVIGEKAATTSSAKGGGKADPVWDEDVMMKLQEEEGGDKSCHTMLIQLHDGGKDGIVAWTELPLFPLELIESEDEPDEVQRVVWYPLVRGHLPAGKDGIGLPKDLKTAGKIALQIRYFPEGKSPIRTSSAPSSGQADINNTKGFPQLQVEAVEAKGLKQVEMFGNQDPYIKVELLGTSTKSQGVKVDDGGTDPKWLPGKGLLPVIPLPPSLDSARITLRIQVLNGQTISLARNAVIGQCDWVIPQEVLAGRPLERWFPLQDKDASKPSGQVLLKMHVMNPVAKDTGLPTIDTNSNQSETPPMKPPEQPPKTVPPRSNNEKVDVKPAAMDNNDKGLLPTVPDQSMPELVTTSTSSRSSSDTGGPPVVSTPRPRKDIAQARQLIEAMGGKPPIKLSSDVTSWKVMHVIYWLAEIIELPQYAEVFANASVDGVTLLVLNENLVEKELKITSELHRLKLMGHVKLLQEEHQARKEESQRKAEAEREEEKRKRAEAEREEARRVRAEEEKEERRRKKALEAEREEERRRQVEADRKAKKELIRLKRENSKKAVEVGANPGGIPPAEDGVSQILQRVKLERMIAEKRKADAMEADEPVAKWKFAYDGANETNPMPEQEQGYRDALKRMWADMHGGENLIMQDGEVRTFPPHSSWFEILAVLREGLKDLGRKLLMEEEMKAMQQADSDLGSDPWEEEVKAHLGSEEERGLELVYRSLVGLKNNGARWLGPNDRLTRLKLLGGIRKLLRLDLSWEQFDNLYRYLSPDANGKKAFLTVEEFVEAFAHPMVGSPAKKRLRSNAMRKGLRSSVDKDLWGDGTAKGVMLVRRVMGVVSSTLLDHGLSLQEAIWCFDRNGDQTVSLSEFASLMKLLVGSLATKHDIYLMMNAIDSSLDRRLQNEELLEFFYIFWSDQLRQIKYRLERTPLDASLQKQQHELRTLISKNFTRDFRDKMKGRDQLVGPFAALLRKMGMVANQELQQQEQMKREERDALAQMGYMAPTKPKKKRSSRAHRAGRNSILQYRLHSAKFPQRDNAVLGIPKANHLDAIRLTTAHNHHEFVEKRRLFTEPTTPPPTYTS